MPVKKLRAPGETASPSARVRLLEAAETCLLRDGYAALSTRAVAELAETQLSQIHYHFGSRQGLVLALLEHQNGKLLKRQSQMFSQEVSLSERWLQACDFLDEDIRSGYVRVLQEIIAAGYSDKELAKAARKVLDEWFVLLNDLAKEAGQALGGWGTLTNEDVGCLVGLAFLGAESMILIRADLPIRRALRAIGTTLQQLETRQKKGGGHGR